jgi:hypothetical protein
VGGDRSVALAVFIKVVLPLEGIDPPFISSSVSSVALFVICLIVVLQE